MSDNPLLKTPGEMINEAREAQDLTIAQLSERTKIPPPVLVALELDEYHKISGPLYIKSFLRTCALDLGLDPQTVLSLYNKISGERASGPVGSEMLWNEEEVEVSRVGVPWLRIIMGVGVVAVLIGLGLFALRGCGNAGNELGDEFTATVSRPDPDETVPAMEDSFRDRNEGRDTASQLSDTLALGWILNPEIPATEKEIPTPPESGMVPAEPVQDVREIESGASSIEDSTVEIVEEKPPVTAPTQEETPLVTAATPEKIESVDPQAAPPAVARVDSAWPLVLRLVCDAPQKIQVKRDGDRNFSEVRWPAEMESAPAVPAAGFEAGRAYRQGDRLVVFWGAEDHFSLKLARVRGVEISINGRVRDVGSLRPGQELILDVHSAGSTPRR